MQNVSKPSYTYKYGKMKPPLTCLSGKMSTFHAGFCNVKVLPRPCPLACSIPLLLNLSYSVKKLYISCNKLMKINFACTNQIRICDISITVYYARCNLVIYILLRIFRLFVKKNYL